VPIIPIPCQEIVLRAILRRGWVDENARITAHAFIRWPKDNDGLSVNLRSKTDVESWLSSFKKSYGAASLHCGRIRDLGLGLDVVQMEADEQPEHAVITGLPYQDDDPYGAERLASELVKIARVFDTTKRTKNQYQ